MRVLHFCKIYPPDSYGGIEQVIHTLASNGAARGVENRVAVLSPHGGAIEHHPAGYQIRRYNQTFQLASTGFSASFLADFSRQARWADVLHFHFPWPFADLSYLLSPVKRPSVLTYHSDVVNQVRLLKLYRPLRDWLLRKSDRIVATSPNYVASSPVLTTYRDKTRIIPIGIDDMPYRMPAGSWRKRIGERYFAFLGVLRYYKGLSTLLEALHGRDYPVALIGDGPEAEVLKQQVIRLGLRNVHFLGALPEEEKHAVLADAYGFVFPSHVRSEAFGIALLEAAQHSLPMITCEIGTGTTFVNLHEQTGLTTAPGDSAGLRAALDRLWQDPHQAREWGENARRRYEAEFTAGVMVRRYHACYEEVRAR